MVWIQVEIDDKMYNRICESIGKVNATDFRERFKITMNNAVVTYLADAERAERKISDFDCEKGHKKACRDSPCIYMDGRGKKTICPAFIAILNETD